ncbi:MAG: hypothetical protein KF778_08335 [Rhodocyclaceae bacterium]|nr:hypothetical protein [Rhodocyclaceae bacterium]MBX3668394.1 hypothetical protein [Rhodocyclaceae bacterium]
MQHNLPGSTSFGRLLFRFLWPFQYFRDCSRGSKIERVQNYRHNRAMRIYLPGFIAKWSALTVASFGAGGVFEGALQLILPATACFLTGTWTLLVSVVLAVAYLWLERFPELY